MKNPLSGMPDSGLKNAANCFGLNTPGDSLVTAARRGSGGVINRGWINNRSSVVGDSSRVNNTPRINNTLRIVSCVNGTICGIRRIVGIVAACFCPLGCGERYGC